MSAATLTPAQETLSEAAETLETLIDTLEPGTGYVVNGELFLDDTLELMQIEAAEGACNNPETIWIWADEYTVAEFSELVAGLAEADPDSLKFAPDRESVMAA